MVTNDAILIISTAGRHLLYRIPTGDKLLDFYIKEAEAGSSYDCPLSAVPGQKIMTELVFEKDISQQALIILNPIHNNYKKVSLDPGFLMLHAPCVIKENEILLWMDAICMDEFSQDSPQLHRMISIEREGDAFRKKLLMQTETATGSWAYYFDGQCIVTDEIVYHNLKTGKQIDYGPLLQEVQGYLVRVRFLDTQKRFMACVYCDQIVIIDRQKNRIVWTYTGKYLSDILPLSKKKLLIGSWNGLYLMEI